ncbi:hypothetical protein BG000_003109, partial [Podila horticola]
KTLYRMFRNHHSEFSLTEWRQFHRGRFDDYIACRYVLDNVVNELPEDERIQVRQIYMSTTGRNMP